MVFSVQRSKTGGPQDFLLQYTISIPKTISQPYYNSKCKWIAPHNTGFTNNLKKTNTTTSPALVTHKLKSLIKLIYLYPANSWYEITDSRLPLKSSKKTQFLSNRRHYNHFVPRMKNKSIIPAYFRYIQQKSIQYLWPSTSCKLKFFT